MQKIPTGNVTENCPQLCSCDLHKSVVFTTQTSITIFIFPNIIAKKCDFQRGVKSFVVMTHSRLEAELEQADVTSC